MLSGNFRQVESLEREPSQRLILTLKLLMCWQVERKAQIRPLQASSNIHVLVFMCVVGHCMDTTLADKRISLLIPTISTAHQHMYHTHAHMLALQEQTHALFEVISSEYTSCLV